LKDDDKYEWLCFFFSIGIFFVAIPFLIPALNSAAQKLFIIIGVILIVFSVGFWWRKKFPDIIYM